MNIANKFNILLNIKVFEFGNTKLNENNRPMALFVHNWED